MPNDRAPIIIGIVALGLLLSRNRAGSAARTSPFPASPVYGSAEPQIGQPTEPVIVADSGEVTTDVAPGYDMGTSNLAAFLALIRHAEARDNYAALVGGGTFDDFSDHPANLGWPGIVTPNGRSTAAGGYQITQTTYNGFRQLGWKRGMRIPPPNDAAPDFTVETQDELAAKLIAGRRALDDVMAGNMQIALVKLRGEWEAFDRMLKGSYPITLAQAQDYYISQGGSIA